MEKVAWSTIAPIIRANAGKLPAKEIAVLCGITISSLYYHCSSHGLSLKVDSEIRKNMAKARKARKKKSPHQTKPVNIDSLWRVPQQPS